MTMMLVMVLGEVLSLGVMTVGAHQVAKTYLRR
jgi:hypothetical protein